MHAIPQAGGSQAQGLSGLFSLSGDPASKDGRGFEKELTKRMDDASAIEQSRISGKPEKNKSKKEDDGASPSRQPDIELPLVVPAIMPVFNLTPPNAIAVTPAGIESATGVPSNAGATPADANDGAVNDVRVDSGLNAGVVAGNPLGEAADEKRITGSLEQVQTADPNEAQEVHAAKDDHRHPSTAGREADTPAAGLLFRTAAGERDSGPSTERLHKKDMSPRSSGEVHEKKKEVSGKEQGQTEPVTTPEEAAPPVDQTEQPAPLDAVAQATPSFSVVTDQCAVSTPVEEIKARALKPVEPITLKESDRKSAMPVENPRSIKDHNGRSGEGKGLEQSDGAVTARPGTQLYEQTKQAFTKINADKAPEVLPGMQPAVNTPSVPADTKHSSAGQPQSAGQMSTPDIVVPVSTPADVVHAVRMFERDGQAEMHIGVRSETLGTIDVKTTVHDGSVGVSIGVERHEVRSALVSELPGLENSLRERDLRLGEVKFHDMGSALASEYGNGQQRQPQEFSRQPASAFYRAAKVNSESNDLPVEVVTTITRRGISVHV